MRTFLVLALSTALLVACDENGKDLAGTHMCSVHPEPPFTLASIKRGADTSPGPRDNVGIVFGTADFDDQGTVLIKLQVETQHSVGTAYLKAWAGMGALPTDPLPPDAGELVYDTGTDNAVRLFHWTPHMAHSYTPGEDFDYWMIVELTDLSSGTPVVTYYGSTWDETGERPDEPNDFYVLSD